MKIQYILGTVMYFIIAFISCTKADESTSKLLPELIKAEEIMYEAPDSALHILQTMPVPSPSDKLQYSTWALFMTQAKYKLYISQTDSLIDVAYSYFIRKNNVQRKAMVLYYKAALFKEQQKNEEAQEFSLKAIQEVEKTNDYRLAHLIYAGLGSLYLDQSLDDYACDVYEKAHKYAIQAGNSKEIAASYIYLARIYKKIGRVSKAISYYKKGLTLSKKRDEEKITVNAMNEISNLYSFINELDSALFYAKESINYRKDHNLSESEQLYLIIGNIFMKKNCPDSAFIYLNKALTSSNIYTRKDSYLDLYNLSVGLHSFKDATKYLHKAWILNDSIQTNDKSEALIEMQEKYNQQKVINEKNEIELKKNKIIRNVLVSLFFFVCFISIIMYWYQRKIIQKERKIQISEEKLRLKSIQIQENESIINRNQIRIELLESEIEKNKGIQEQMDEQMRILTNIRTYNKKLEYENSILQNDIDIISNTLKEKSNEINKLKVISVENQYLQDRANFLSNQLVAQNVIFLKLKSKPKYIEETQWNEIISNVNFIYDNYTDRLSKLIPTLTESDIQICCLIKLHLPNPIIADLLAISPTSVTKRKMRVKERILSQIGSFKESQSLDVWLWDF